MVALDSDYSAGEKNQTCVIKEPLGLGGSTLLFVPTFSYSFQNNISQDENHNFHFADEETEAPRA